MKTKKLLSVILAALMILSCFGLTSVAADEKVTLYAKDSAFNEKASWNTTNSKNVTLTKNGMLWWTVGDDFNDGMYTLDLNFSVNNGERFMVYINDVKVNTTGYFANSTSWENMTKTIAENIEIKKGDKIAVEIDNVTAVISYLSLTKTGDIIIEEPDDPNVTTLYAKDSAFNEKASWNTSNSENVTLTKNGMLWWTVGDDFNDGMYTLDLNFSVNNGERFMVYINDVKVNTTDYFANSTSWENMTKTIAENIAIKKGDKIAVEIDNITAVVAYLTLTRAGDIIVSEPEEDITILEDGTIKVQAEAYDVTVSSGSKIDATGMDGFVGYYSSSTIGFNLDISEAGMYEVYARTQTAVAQWDNLKVDGVTVRSGLSVETSDSFRYGYVNLKEGNNLIQFFNQGGGNYLYMDYFTLKKVGEYGNAHTYTSLSGSAGLCDGGMRMKGGGKITYKTTVPSDGKYTLRATLKSTQPGSAHYTSVFVNGTESTRYGSEEIFLGSEKFTFDYASVDLYAGNEIELVFYNGGSYYLEFYNYELIRTGDTDPVSITLKATSANIENNSGTTSRQGQDISFQVSDALSWTINIPVSGKYDIVANFASIGGVKFNVYVGDNDVVTTGWLSPVYKDNSLANPAIWSNAASADRVILSDYQIESGNHTIKVEIPSIAGNGACVFSYITISRQEDIETEPTIFDYLINDATSITVNTEECWGGETVYAAIYHKNTLKKVFSEIVDEDDPSSTIVHLDKLVLAEGENISDYSFKLFVWDSMSPVINEPQYEIGMETVLYVSPKGSDSNTGTALSPVTLEKAQLLAREASKTGDVVVNIGAGEYLLTSPLQFTELDSTSNGAIVSYVGSSDGKTVLNGGKKIEEWNPSSISNVYVAEVDVPSLRQLWVDGVKATRATSGKMTGDSYYDDTSDSSYSVDGVVISAADLPSAIAAEEDLEFVWDTNWSKQRFNVSKVNSDGNKVSFLLDDYGYAYNNFSSETNTKPEIDMEFRIENALCYLDEPGEFYFDKTKKLLYYYPLSGQTMNTAECYIGVSEGLININNSSNLNFQNLILKHGTWLRPNDDGVVYGQGNIIHNYDETPIAAKYFGGGITPAQVTVRDSENIHFDNVDVINVGSAGYSFLSGVKNSSIKNSDIIGVSAGGLIVGTWRVWEKQHYGAAFDGLTDGTTNYDKTFALCDNIEIVNNVISDVAYEFGGQSGIDVYYVANTKIDHNTLSNLSYTGISYGFGWSLPSVAGCFGNTITGNLIENYMVNLNDGGGIYTLGKSGMPEISANYLKDANRGLREANGLYADQGTNGAIFKNNVVEDSNQWLWVRDGADIKNVKITNNYSDTQDVRYTNTTDTSVAVISGTVYSTTGSEASAIKAAAGAGR